MKNLYKLAFAVTVASGVVVGLLWVIQLLGTTSELLTTLLNIGVAGCVVGGMLMGITYFLSREK